MGINWTCPKGSKNGRPTEKDKDKPILLIAPGLGGASTNLYSTGMNVAAYRQGYTVGTIIFRGGDGIPITSGKISYSGCWEDAKEVLEYAHNKYVKKGCATRMYAFGSSLGAQVLGLYMLHEGENARKIIDGCVLFGTPWSTTKSSNWFYESQWMYSMIIGMNVSEKLRKT